MSRFETLSIVSLLLSLLLHEAAGWSFTITSVTSTLTEGGSVPQTIATVASPLPPSPGSGATDSFLCQFGGSYSNPSTVYEKFTFTNDVYSAVTPSTCTLTQITSISCSTDVTTSWTISLYLQMSDQSQNYYYLSYSGVQEYVINVDCSTTSTSTSTTTTPHTETPWASTPVGIAVITVSCVVGAGLLAAMIYLFVECSKEQTAKVEVMDMEESTWTPRPRQKASEWTYYDVT